MCLIHAAVIAIGFAAVFLLIDAMISHFFPPSPDTLVRYFALGFLVAVAFGVFARRHYQERSFVPTALLAGAILAGTIMGPVFWPVVSGGLLAGFVLPLIPKQEPSNRVAGD